MVPAAIFHSFAHRLTGTHVGSVPAERQSKAHIEWLCLDTVLSPDRVRSRWDIPSTSFEGGDAPKRTVAGRCGLLALSAQLASASRRHAKSQPLPLALPRGVRRGAVEKGSTTCSEISKVFLVVAIAALTIAGAALAVPNAHFVRPHRDGINPATISGRSRVFGRRIRSRSPATRSHQPGHGASEGCEQGRCGGRSERPGAERQGSSAFRQRRHSNRIAPRR